MLLGLAGLLYLVLQRGLYSWHLAAYSMRLGLWDKAWQLFLMKPWFGWGLGCFGEAYQNMGFDPNTGSRFAHDLPLQVLVELGIPGLVLLLLACFSILKRVKPQPRWEAWGVGTGLLSVFFFSLVDLPFQMPELVVLFAAIAGRIELKEKDKNSPSFAQRASEGRPPRHQGTKKELIIDEKNKPLTRTVDELLWNKNLLGLGGAEWLLLSVFLVTGFWPPFKPWNFALLAGTLWVLAGFSRLTHGRVPLWTVLGVLFFVFRALASPSASGCVRFFEMAGILLAFVTILPLLQNKERFLRGFGLLGLAWAVKVWWVTFHYNEGGFGGWIHFQFSDVKDWTIFPNPKQIGLFLVPLLFIPAVFKKRGGWWMAAGAAFMTAIRLKSFGVLLGFFAGLFGLAKRKYLPAILGTALILLAGIVVLRVADPSSTKWGRFEIWDSATRVFAMNPVLGQGPGAFAGLYHRVKEPREGGVSRYLMDARYAHNEALEALAAFGLVGFAFLLAWLIRLWPGKDQSWNKASVLGLGAASLTDFCLHTPLMALWGAAFLNFQGASPDKETSNDLPPRCVPFGDKLASHQDAKKTYFLKTDKTNSSQEAPGAGPFPARGFLALGIALALFAPPSFIPSLTDQFQVDIQANHLPQSLRRIETAESLNPWDAGLAGDKLDFLEKLYLATGDETWKRRADEAQGHVIGLEAADGSLRFEKAQRLTRRMDARPSGDNLSAAQGAWDEAEKAMPTNAFVKFEKAAFYYNKGPGKTGKWDLNTMTDGVTAFMCFRQAEELEPNFAQAWYYTGLCRMGMGDGLASLADFSKAYEVYDWYKSAQRIDPLEKLLVALTPEQMDELHRELGK
jgi:O-antigen ligase/tetratricopeptide (TPR) repeat protein